MSVKGMSGMIRLHKWQLDEKRRSMGELESMRAELVGKMRDLETELATEQKKAADAPVVSISYAGYAQQVMVRRQNLHNSIAEIDVSIDEMKDQVSEAFKELKKYEIVEQRERERELAERNARQQDEMDELALTMHRRSQKQA
ncbi:flagellar FliJ family protein [Paremcibacter congregatus]|uniref:Flagellar FliJ protein n=1 Tax=Paremcibacter congregatus TaxID=2043170 RepID=A0A2G4YUW6_9PROT|nr:flagellar FliJ family protein [Paremcibacter congregatus]PHZ85246.1 flagellar export protein FliJ [Paremcibacter congregatus]QDE27822.1 flagellar export protein FliJ [Paremcibacter congregatus]